jgi:hypothetical protein
VHIQAGAMRIDNFHASSCRCAGAVDPPVNPLQLNQTSR